MCDYCGQENCVTVEFPKGSKMYICKECCEDVLFIDISKSVSEQAEEALKMFNNNYSAK